MGKDLKLQNSLNSSSILVPTLKLILLNNLMTVKLTEQKATATFRTRMGEAI